MYRCSAGESVSLKSGGLGWGRLDENLSHASHPCVYHQSSLSGKAWDVSEVRACPKCRRKLGRG